MMPLEALVPPPPRGSTAAGDDRVRGFFFARGLLGLPPVTTISNTFGAYLAFAAAWLDYPLRRFSGSHFLVRAYFSGLYTYTLPVVL